METRDERIQVLEEELRSIKKSFEVLLLAIEAEGVLAASDVADRLMGRLVTLMNDIKTAYVEDIFDRRFRALTDDRQRLAETRASGRPSTDAFIELVGRIERHISTADREFRLLVPRKSGSLRLITQHWKKAALVAVAGLIVLGAGTFLRDFMTRGKGLTAQYYDGTNFTKLIKTRRDLQVDFDFNGRAPVRGAGTDNYSIRWTGTLRAPSDGDYEFVTRSDDGVRLWIDDEAIIDNWTIHRAAIDKGVKNLAAGPHKIRIDYFQRRGPASIRLFWRTTNDAQPRVIESDYLMPS